MSQEEHTLSAPLSMTEVDFAALGDGEIAYIKTLSPSGPAYLSAVGGVRRDHHLRSHAADGTPLALTDTHFAAVENAKEHDSNR